MTNAIATSTAGNDKAPGSHGLGLIARVTPRQLVIGLVLLTAGAYWAVIPFVNLQLTRGHVIGSDGLFYYEYLPSLFLDGDLDFRNQREVLIADGVPYDWGALHPSAGNVTYFAPGWAVLVAPFFVLAHAIARTLAWFQPMRLDGYGFLYESVTNFGAVSYGCAGVLLVFETLRFWWNDRIASLTTLGVLGATNLAYYVVAQASMAHAVGFFCVAGALYSCCLLEPGSFRSRYALALGMFSGLAFIVRPQLALCVLPLFAQAALRRTPVRLLLIAGAAALAVASIQLFCWYLLFGQAVVVPQGKGFLRWQEPMLVELLFSLRHGLFSWHPFYLLCCLGLLFGPASASCPKFVPGSPRPRCAGEGRVDCVITRLRRGVPMGHFAFGLSSTLGETRRGLRVSPTSLAVRALAIVVIALQVYVNASVSDWWAGNAFGQRRLIDILPFFALGGAALLQRFARRPLAAPLALSGLLAWNALFMIQYRFGYIPRGQALTWQQLVLDKLRLPALRRSY